MYGWIPSKGYPHFPNHESEYESLHLADRELISLANVCLLIAVGVSYVVHYIADTQVHGGLPWTTADEAGDVARLSDWTRQGESREDQN